MKMIRGRFRAVVLMGAAASVLALAAGVKAQNQNSNDNTWPHAAAERSPVLAVVGDISCQPGEEVTGETMPGVSATGAPTTGEVCSDSLGDQTVVEPLWQSQEATANQIEAMKPDAVALLGDLQYQVGRYSDFEQSFDLTYGAFKFLHRPAPGNHEFYSEHGQTGVAGYGYFSYYNGFLINNEGMPLATEISDPCINPTNPAPSTNVASASCKAGKTPTADLSSNPIPRADGQAGHFDESGGPESAIVPSGGPVGVGDGWYSYNLGSWHLISLNIECYSQPGGCSPTGTWFAAELAWLKQDLEQNHSSCTLAYWHQPTFSATNGISQEGQTAQAFWKLLYEYRADLVLNGHDHLYARYRPLDYLGNSDPRNGIREFIVGTGGETLDPVVTSNTTTADPTGNPNFNAENLETPTGGTAAEGGEFWGVMALTLEPNGYKWDFKSALPDLQQTTATASFSDAGVGYCHGGRDGRFGW